MDKRCSKCGEIKSLTEFRLHKDKPYSHCTPCAKEAQARYYKSDKRQEQLHQKSEYIKITRREYLYQKKYGITLAEYNIMLEEQDHKCAICNLSCSTGNELCIDHDHTTGKVRGLLCFKCNRGLGMFCDMAANCWEAGNYLEKHGS